MGDCMIGQRLAPLCARTHLYEHLELGLVFACHDAGGLQLARQLNAVHRLHHPQVGHTRHQGLGLQRMLMQGSRSRPAVSIATGTTE